MISDPQNGLKPVLWLLLAIASAACMQLYVARIWSAGQPRRFSDLYAPWWASHELFLHARNPYSPAVAREIQTMIYGAPVAAQTGRDYTELAGGFSYPLYATFLMWPTVRLPFSVLQPLFISVAAAVTLGSIILWLRAFHFRGPPVEWLTLTFFTLGSFPVLQGIHLQNLSLVAASLVTLSVVLLCTEHLALAGFFLAASTFKPQFTVVLAPWLVLWAASDWHRRKSFAWAFFTGMLLLVGTSEWMQPGWIGDFLRVVHAYRQYTFGHSLLDVWFSPRFGPFAAAALLLVVLAISWPYRRLGTDSPAFLLIIGIMLAATLTTIPTLAPHTHLLLLPGLFCLYCNRRVLWSIRPARFVLLALCLLLAWPWIAAAGLTLAAFVFPLNALLRWWDLPLYTSPILPLAVLVTLSCLIRVRIWPSRTHPGPPL
ncbi:MAG: glycosyltransferase family 87 protein [Candidatus Sulfotelmatobacter sp.]